VGVRAPIVVLRRNTNHLPSPSLSPPPRPTNSDTQLGHECRARVHDRDERYEVEHTPDRLFGEEVRVPIPRPQPASTETTGGVVRSPRKTCARPLRTGVVRDRRTVFPCVIGELLVVRGELPCEKRDHCEREDAVGRRQRRLVRRGDQRQGGPEEQESVLDRSDEGQLMTWNSHAGSLARRTTQQ